MLRIIIKFFSLHSNSSHLMSFFLTFQNSLSVYILLNYSNFIDTVALLKCIIKRTMLILTDNVHSICKLKVYCKSKSWWKLIWWDQRTLQATEQQSCSHIQTTTQTKTIQCLKRSEWDQQSSDERQCKRRDRTRTKEQRYSW